MRAVVVTGASTGIGEATVRMLVAEGFVVFGSVRTPADADRLERDLGPCFRALTFDVTDPAAVSAAAVRVAGELGGRTLFGLVNNAGVAVPGPLLYLSMDDFRRQLDVNLIGQLIVTQRFAPLLGAAATRTGDPGRIVMMSSVGGRVGAPFIGAYSASKFALEGLSESLRRELMLFGIDVIVIAPGAVATPIWDKAETLDPGAFAHTPYVPALTLAKAVIARGRRGLPPERIARAVVHALTTRRPKVRYTVTPTPFQQWLARIVPDRVMDWIIARRLQLLRR
jgi:NAD(P)-dependent dehydrogenase (short-subunit alcohol dehydrogenase family)